MKTGTTRDTDLIRCSRCGSTARDPEAGHCSCCGNSMHRGSSLAMGLPKESARPVDAVRQHYEYARWMQDQPSGIAQVLGMALVVVLGLALAMLALGGALHVRGTDRDSVTAVCVGIGALLALWNGWRILCFYQAPLLHRVARVVDERTRSTHTQYGWRKRHYATFEFENGLRLEFPVSSGMAAQVVRGACGVAITRDTFLLAFHRTGPG
jgi:hypothetical protein